MHYVLADIHGNERRFRSILQKIRLRDEDTLYVLGDVVDRNSGSIRILRRLMAMPNAKMLLGNHEYMMLRALGHPYDGYADNGKALAHWYRNGGDITHRQFKYQRKAVREQILAFLLGLPLQFDLTVDGKAYKLVHAAPQEAFDGDPKYPTPAHFAVWKRFAADETFPADYTLIFGHTPTRYFQESFPMEVWQGEGRIGIDCGCAYPAEVGGRQVCLRLEDGKLFYSE